MKTILIMRHAKASWEDTSLSDFERPLNQQGLKAAPFMGNIICKNGFQTDHIVSSTAKRAKQTAILVRSSAEIDPVVHFDERIYEASPIALLNLIGETEEKHDSLMLIGHNPGIESLIRVLTREIQSMPTASIARIKLNIEKWSDVAENCGFLEVVIHPEDLMKKTGNSRASSLLIS